MAKEFEQEYGKVVNVSEDGQITVLDSVFRYNDGFKGAVGSKFYPVSEEEYEERTTKEAIIEYLFDAIDEDEEYIENMAEEIIGNGLEGETMFDNSYPEYWDEMRKELGLSEEDAFIFDCVGGGRCFDKDFQGNVNPELSAIIRQYESKD